MSRGNMFVREVGERVNSERLKGPIVFLYNLSSTF